jgi:hypothetical protein
MSPGRRTFESLRFFARPAFFGSPPDRVRIERHAMREAEKVVPLFDDVRNEGPCLLLRMLDEDDVQRAVRGSLEAPARVENDDALRAFFPTPGRSPARTLLRRMRARPLLVTVTSHRRGGMIRSHLRPCAACSRHVRVSERACPFCHAATDEAFRRSPAPLPPSRRLSRAALFAYGTGALVLPPATVVLASAAFAIDCDMSSSEYGGAPPVVEDAGGHGHDDGGGD